MLALCEDVVCGQAEAQDGLDFVVSGKDGCM